MAELRDLGGRPAIFIDGVPYPPMMATVRTMRDGKEIIFDKDYFKNLGDAGIKIYFLICDTVWLKPDAIRLFDEEARALLDAVPDAYIMPRIGMHPTNEWILSHPEECITYTDGEKPGCHLFSESYETDIPMHYSLASSKWREDAGRALAETWKILMSLPYADRIIGCFLAAGGTSEWYYMLPAFNEKNETVAGHCAAFKREFSAYLTEKYGSDENLRKHWKNPDATLLDPPIPDYEKAYFVTSVDKLSAQPNIRMYTNNPTPPPYTNGYNLGSFVNPETAMDVYDFLRVWNLGTANSVLHFARVIKELTPDRLVGAFYGSQGCTNFVTAGTACGTVKVLESEYVDFLAAPGVYENRLAGGFEGQRQVQDSFAVNGKIYIVEQDTRTLAENRYFMDKCQIYDMQDSLNVMKREFGRTIAEDVQAWWFDQLIGGRRYKYQEIYSLIREQQKIAKTAYTLDRRKMSDIALIFDEESMHASSFQSTRDAVELFRNYEIARVGAPCDQYYHNDMGKANMPSYKLYVFMNVYVLTEEERRVIREKIKKDGAVALWLYAPGVIDPDADEKTSLGFMEELTGMKMEMINERFDTVFRWNGEEHPISRGFDKRALYGKFDRIRLMMLTAQHDPLSRYDTYAYPFYYPVDKDAKVLARLLTTGYPAVTVKETGDYTSILYCSKCLKSEVLRAIARFAGCHIYCDSDDVLYASRNYVTLHSSASGKKTVRFKEPVSPYEVYEKKFYGHNITELEVDTYLGQTYTWQLIKE